MNNKLYHTTKAIALLVVLIIVLTTFLLGTSYAYMTKATSNAAANVNLNKLPEKGGDCTITNGTAKTSAAISVQNMQQSKKSTTAKTTATSNNLTVNLTPPSATIVATCAFDLKWKWTNTGGYTQSTGLGTKKELTYTLQEYNGTSWVNTISETQFTTAAANVETKLTSVSVSTSSDASVVKNYRILLKWYNADVVQDNHKGKKYTGVLFATEPQLTLN